MFDCPKCGHTYQVKDEYAGKISNSNTPMLLKFIFVGAQL